MVAIEKLSPNSKMDSSRGSTKLCTAWPERALNQLVLEEHLSWSKCLCLFLSEHSGDGVKKIPFTALIQKMICTLKPVGSTQLDDSEDERHKKNWVSLGTGGLRWDLIRQK